jgi:hypothetical protein
LNLMFCFEWFNMILLFFFLSFFLSCLFQSLDMFCNLINVLCVFTIQRRRQQNKQTLSFDWSFFGGSDRFRTRSESPWENSHSHSHFISLLWIRRNDKTTFRYFTFTWTSSSQQQIHV